MGNLLDRNVKLHYRVGCYFSTFKYPPSPSVTKSHKISIQYDILPPTKIAPSYEVELTVEVVHPNLPKCVYHKDERHFWLGKL